MDFYDKSVFEVIGVDLDADVDWSVVDEYSWIHSFIHTYIYSFGIMNSNHPSAIVCDFYLTGAQVASLSNSVPLVLYSVDPLSDFYPATFSFSDMRRHLLVEMAVEHHTTFVYSIWLCHQ